MSENALEKALKPRLDNLLALKAHHEKMMRDQRLSSVEQTVATSFVLTVNELISIWNLELAIVRKLKDNSEYLQKQIDGITAALASISSINELKHEVEEMKKKWSIAEPALTSLQSLIDEVAKSGKETKKVVDGLYT